MHLVTERDPDGGWYDRYVRLYDEEAELVKDFGKNPTLDVLREAERCYGTCINLWQQGLICSNCRNQITDRFSADLKGHLLCWECAMSKDQESKGGLRFNADPTQSVLSESKLHEKSLCDYVINVATGCRHGCRFCYVPSTPAIDSRNDMLKEKAGIEDPQLDWGSYLLYRDDLPERTHEGLQNVDFEEEWKTTYRGRGIVMLSSGTDCYQDRRTAQITRGCVRELVNHGVPVRILTRSPNVIRDIDLFKEADGKVSVGLSIPTFNTSLVKAMEPHAPPPMARWEALDQMYRNDIPRFVSFSPTYPTMERGDIEEAMSWFRAIDPDVVFHEPINPRGANYQMCIEATENAGYNNVTEELRVLQNKERWVEYSLEHIRTVRDVGEEYGVHIHTWPDRQLIKATKGKTQKELIRYKNEVSPESFASSGPR